ncbi:hypothetical protein STENM36S_02097 [Streptomyces tendae]
MGVGLGWRMGPQETVEHVVALDPQPLRAAAGAQPASAGRPRRTGSPRAASSYAAPGSEHGRCGGRLLRAGPLGLGDEFAGLQRAPRMRRGVGRAVALRRDRWPLAGLHGDGGVDHGWWRGWGRRPCTAGSRCGDGWRGCTGWRPVRSGEQAPARSARLSAPSFIAGYWLTDRSCTCRVHFIASSCTRRLRGAISRTGLAISPFRMRAASADSSFRAGATSPRRRVCSVRSTVCRTTPGGRGAVRGKVRMVGPLRRRSGLGQRASHSRRVTWSLPWPARGRDGVCHPARGGRLAMTRHPAPRSDAPLSPFCV